MKNTFYFRTLLSVLLLLFSVYSFSQNRLITVTPITTGGCGQNATGTLTLDGYTRVIRWEVGYLTDNGIFILDEIINTTANQISYNISTTTVFRVKIDASIYSYPEIINVDESPATVAGPISPSSAYFCGSGSGTITLTGQVGSVVQWEKNEGSGWASIGNAGSTTLNYSNLGVTAQYRAAVRSGTCALMYSNTASVTINAVPYGEGIVGGGTYCNKASAVELKLIGYAGTISKWESSTNDGNTWNDIANTTSILNVHNVVQSTKYRVLLTSPSCGQAYSNIVGSVKIDPLPVAGTLNVSAGLSPCQGTATSIGVTGNLGTPLYWVSSNNGATWDIHNQADLGTSFPLSFPTPGKWVVKTQSYTATCGLGTEYKEINIGVRPLPNAPLVDGAANVLSGSTMPYTVTNFAGSSYTWTVTNGTLLTGLGTSSVTAKFQAGQAAVRVVAENECGQGPATILPIASGVNYVRTQAVLVGGKTDEADLASLSVNDKSVSTTYFDGLGRSLQTVDWQASNSKSDIVQSFVYDQFGRESKTYLPYVGGNDGNYKIDAASNQLSFYAPNSNKIASDANPYAETKFEPSPLNRVLKQGAPGAAWQPDALDDYASLDRTVKKSYELNGASEVLLFSYDPSTGKATPGAVMYYEANQLSANKTKDEHNNEVIEYVDKDSHLICKKVQFGVDGSGAVLYASTYYIYDDFGNLIAVLPPEAVKQYLAN